MSNSPTWCRWCAAISSTCSPFNRTVDNRAAVQQLYRAMYALPPFTHEILCPSDWGVDIHFTFSHEGTSVLTARPPARDGVPIPAILVTAVSRLPGSD